MSVLTPAVSVPSAPAEGVIALMLCASVRSTSVKAIVPLSVRLPTGRHEFGHPAGDIDRRHDRNVVRAGDVDAHGARHNAAVAVQNIKAEGLDLVLVLRQVFHRRGRNAVVPGHHATKAGAGRVGAHTRRQRAERPRRRRDRADAVRIGQVDVGKGNRAAVGQIADRGHEFGHPAA